MLELLLAISIIGGPAGHADRRFAVTAGNVRTKFFNTGAICGPDRVNPWPRMEWPANSGHTYLYEAGLLIGARVKAYDPVRHDSVWIWIVDDPIQNGGDEDFEPYGGYANPQSDTFAISNNNLTWPSVWPDYITILGDTISNLSGSWPGEFWGGRMMVDTIHGQESFWAMCDSANVEFMPGNSSGNPYYDPGNNMRGLGLTVYGRSYVVTTDTLMRNAIIFDYIIINTSARELDSLVVGYYLDPKIGGPGPDAFDDMYEVDTSLQTFRFYDQDGQGIDADGNPYQTGQFAFVFLQTPGNASDGINNDGDFFIDESPTDGIDNDGDWDPYTDDVGADGIPNTHDFGEMDLWPTVGEPHFEWRDPDEIDEMGLTAAHNFIIGAGGAFAANDSVMGEFMRPGVYDVSPGPGDLVTLVSSGFFRLLPGERTRFVVAFVFDPHRNNTNTLYARVRRLYRIYRNFLGAGIPPAYYQMNFVSPSPGEVISGNYQIEWSPQTHNPEIQRLAASWNNGISYNIIVSFYQVPGSSFSWDTHGWPDGSLYRLKLELIDQQLGFGYAESGIFILDNPDVNGRGMGVILTDNFPDSLRNTISLPVVSGDPEGDDYEVKIFLSVDNMRSWALIYDSIFNATLDTSIFQFDTREYPNTDSAYFAVVCNSQGTEDTTQIAGPFTIANYRHYQSGDSVIAHVAGTGDGEITICKLGNPTTDDTFRLTFTTQNGAIYYSLYNLNSGNYVFTNYPLIPGLESPDFGNMRLLISTVTDTVPGDTSNMHIAGNSNFSIDVQIAPRGIKLPHDYIIHFYDHLVGLAMYNTIRDTITVNFTVLDRTSGELFIPVFVDGDLDSIIANPNGRDALFPVYYQNGHPVPTWKLRFFGPYTNPVPPSDGDIYYVRILDPFDESDTFLIYASRVTSVHENNRGGKLNLQMPTVMLKNRKIQLSLNLPTRTDLSIKVYDVSGRLRIQKFLNSRGPGLISVNIPAYDLRSGIYFLTVKTGIGQKITKKFIILR